MSLPDTKTSLKVPGLSTRQLNFLFGGLFGFPALMGLCLWAQSLDVSSLWPSDSPMALSAPAQDDPPQTFEAMLNPPWMEPRDLAGFGRENMFEERFNLGTGSLVALLDLPNAPDSAPSQDDDDLLSQIAYGKFAKEMNFTAPDDPKSFSWSVPVQAGENLSGKVEVLDADALAVGAARVRLAGLVPPEAGRTCTLLSGEKSDCRKAAIDQLGFYLRSRIVACTVESQNAEGEALASCQVGTSDIGEWLVRRGWALPEASGQQRYRPAAFFAQNYRLGQWRP